MKINKLINQHRRDFTAEYICEHCGYAYVGSGYDDNNFHVNVIPTMKCPDCGEISPDEYRAFSPKYSPDEIV